MYTVPFSGHVHVISFFALYSLLLLSFFLYLKSVPIHVIVHVYIQCTCMYTSAWSMKGIMAHSCDNYSCPYTLFCFLSLQPLMGSASITIIEGNVSVCKILI